MNICFVLGDINKTGGTERVCLLIANELVKKYNITILSLKNGLNPSFKYNKKIKLETLNLQNCLGFFKRKIAPYRRLKKFLKKNNQDIIINVDVLCCLYTLPMKRIFNIKIIAWEHFNFRTNNGTKNRDLARKLSAKYADYIIVLTKSDLNEYKNSLNVKCPIKTIYNPIVGEIKSNELNSNIVLASGRFTPQKNFEELIYIWEHIEKNNPQWKLIICGDGIDFNNIKKLVTEKGLNNIILPGFCTNIDDYYSNASIFAMTSRFEGFPMVLLEAQQYSIPLIAYDCFTGPSEIIENGKNGYLIEYGNRKEYISKLNDLMNDIDKLKIFSNNSSEMVKKYDIHSIICEWYKVLENINRKSD